MEDELTPQQRAAVTRKKNMEAKDTEAIEMNDLALRIFEGQSPDLPKKVRVERITMRLKNKGYKDMSKLKLPLVGFERFI